MSQLPKAFCSVLDKLSINIYPRIKASNVSVFASSFSFILYDMYYFLACLNLVHICVYFGQTNYGGIMKKNCEINKAIKCDVRSCKHNDCDYCTLEKVSITCNCDNDDCMCKEETICDSFREK